MQNFNKKDDGDHCVVLLHGLGANELEFIRLVKDLNESGFSLIIPNIEGYSFGSISTLSCADWIDQVLHIINGLQKKFRSVSLVGLSMGAVLSMVASTRTNEPLTALILLSPSIEFDGWAMPWYKFLLRFATWFPIADKYQMKESYPYGVKNDEVRRSIISSLKTKEISDIGAHDLNFDLIKQGYLLANNAKKIIHKITVPLLIIHSVDDEVVHIRNAEKIFRSVQSPTKEIIYLGDSYHMITIDNEYEVVNDQTIEFIKKSINDYLDERIFDLRKNSNVKLRRKLTKINEELFQLIR